METLTSLFDTKGCPLEKQKFTWREMAGKPISKLDDDAFTRVRIILMNGIETDALRLKNIGARFNGHLRQALAEVRRAEQHQATMVNWLLSADHSPLEITVAYEQVAIEVTAAVAQNEPDPYQAQTYRFGLLEDFDHLYRYSAMLDRLEGKDANNILQGYTDIIPSRPTTVHHRPPEDDLRDSYQRDSAALITKIHAAMITAAEYQTHDYYMNIGPTFADPLARQLYAEIASVEEQHVTQYGSLQDPDESFLEKWLIHEAMEVYAYHSCMEQEENPRIKAIWERFLDYEQGHLHLVSELFKKYERRDPAEILGGSVPRLIQFKSQREFVRKTLAEEMDLRTKGHDYVDKKHEGHASLDYRNHMNSEGVPAEAVSAGYQWAPGTELSLKKIS
ncbi:ferritin-like domain-containing protein [Ectopseudomonas mendocina]|uniref:ferritin-like domain-containing protein n=1 Tax=Ectopseudomonas mendocina TaxID=300 RepID=UPI00313320F2